MPFGQFQKDQLISENLICIQDFPNGNVAIEYNKKSLQYLHDYFIQTISLSLESLDPRLIQIRGISFNDFGSSLNLLSNFSEKFLNKISTDNEDLVKLSDELEERILEIRKKCLKTYDSLFEFNDSNSKKSVFLLFCILHN